MCKVIFGAEPKEYEVYEYVLNHWNTLLFSPSIKLKTKKEVRINPKRKQREIRKQQEIEGIGTKSQQALQLQYEENKKARIIKNKEQKELEKLKQFEIHQQKKKQKHRGH